MLPVMKRLNDKLDVEQQERKSHFEKRRQELVIRQRLERQAMNDLLEQRQRLEELNRERQSGHKSYEEQSPKPGRSYDR
jgi:hypothetical protein